MTLCHAPRTRSAGVLWGSSLDWATQVKIVPGRPEIMNCVSRIRVRPAAQETRERDAALAKGGHAGFPAEKGPG